MKQKITPEMISRRKALSLLGFGAALGLTLSSALEPSEAEAQEAAPPAAAPAQATGTHGMQRRQGRRASRMNDATAVMSDDTSDERERNQRRRRLLAHLPRNSRPSALNRLSARFDERRMALRVQRVKR